jgi:hypothetical protein
MAINPSLISFVTRQRVNMNLGPYQANASLFAFAKRRERGMKNISQTNTFTSTVADMIKTKEPYSARNFVPPNLYDVFGFGLHSNRLLMGVTVIVDIDPEIKGTDFRPIFGIEFKSIHAILGEKKSLTPFLLDGDALNARLPKGF